MFRKKHTFDLLVVAAYKVNDQAVIDSVTLQIIRTRANKLVAVRAITGDSHSSVEINADQIAGQFGATARTWPPTIVLTKERLLEVMLSDPWDTYQDKNFWIFTAGSSVVAKMLEFAGAKPSTDKHYYHLRLTSSGRRVTDFKLV